MIASERLLGRWESGISSREVYFRLIVPTKSACLSFEFTSSVVRYNISGGTAEYIWITHLAERVMRHTHPLFSICIFRGIHTISNDLTIWPPARVATLPMPACRSAKTGQCWKRNNRECKIHTLHALLTPLRGKLIPVKWARIRVSAKARFHISLALSLSKLLIENVIWNGLYSWLRRGRERYNTTWWPRKWVLTQIIRDSRLMSQTRDRVTCTGQAWNSRNCAYHQQLMVSCSPTCY